MFVCLCVCVSYVCCECVCYICAVRVCVCVSYVCCVCMCVWYVCCEGVCVIHVCCEGVCVICMLCVCATCVLWGCVGVICMLWGCAHAWHQRSWFFTPCLTPLRQVHSLKLELITCFFSVRLPSQQVSAILLSLFPTPSPSPEVTGKHGHTWHLHVCCRSESRSPRLDSKCPYPLSISSALKFYFYCGKITPDLRSIL